MSKQAMRPTAVQAVAEGALDGNEALLGVLQDRASTATLTGAATLVSALSKPGKPSPLPLLTVAAEWLLAVEARHGQAWAPESRASLWLRLERLAPGHIWTYAGDLALMDHWDVDTIRDRVLTALEAAGAIR